MMYSEPSFKKLLLELNSDEAMRANFLTDPVTVLHQHGFKMGTKAELEMAIFVELTRQDLENLYTRMNQLPEDPVALQKYYDEIKREPDRMIT